MSAKTIREAVAATIAWHGHSDFWVNELAPHELCIAHVRNKLRPNDYLDDMRWAERRRGNGFNPVQRARLDMPTEALLS